MREDPLGLGDMLKACWFIFCSGAWRSLVARTAGGREVAGSNPVAPSIV